MKAAAENKINYSNAAKNQKVSQINSEFEITDDVPALPKTMPILPEQQPLIHPDRAARVPGM